MYVKHLCHLLIFYTILSILLNGSLLLWCRSATFDSHMFSQYFGNCPVVTAQGRTHPVSTEFLEDIYESLNYRLASDSVASIDYGVSGIQKVTSKMVMGKQLYCSTIPFFIPLIHLKGREVIFLGCHLCVFLIVVSSDYLWILLHAWL